LIGTVLIENGAISTSVLRSALEVQAQSKLGVLTIEAAIEAASWAAQMHGKKRPEPAKKTESATRLVNFSGLTQNEESNPEVSELLLQKKNLAFKLVNQYEEITNSVARDLHDTVLADLLAIHRNLSKDEKSEANENLPLLEGVIRQVRELCGEYAPRNISDWGLETVLEDLMDRFERRTQVIGTFIWKARQVSLPEQVELQVFRIVQEGLNNVYKHAKASNVILKVEEKSINTLTISLSDDGQGFPAGAKKQGNSFESGGMGTHNVTERMELIRCYYPATLKIESVPQQGVTVTLEIVISST
jgi:signal transduction histidine kinase